MSTEDEHSIVGSTPNIGRGAAHVFRTAAIILRGAGVMSTDAPPAQPAGMRDIAIRNHASGIDAFIEEMEGSIGLRDERAEALQLIQEIDSQEPETKAQLTTERNQLLVALKGGNMDGLNIERIRQAIDTAKTGTEQQKAVELAEERERLMHNIHRLDKVMDDADRRLAAAGYRDREYEQKLADMERDLAQLQEGSPEWVAKKREIATLRREHYGNVEQQARANGDQPSANVAHRAGQAAQQQIEDLTRVDLINKQQQRGANTSEVEVAPRQSYAEETRPALGIQIDAAPARALGTPIQSTVAAVSFSGFDDSSSVTRTAESGQPAAQQGTEVLPVAMAATFGGFDDVPATVQETPTATVVADARAAVAPSVAMNFSGFDEVETHDAPTVQDMRSKDGKVRTA